MHRRRLGFALLVTCAVFAACDGSGDSQPGDGPAGGSDAGGPRAGGDGAVGPPSSGPTDAGDGSVGDAQPQAVTVHFTQPASDDSPVHVVFYDPSGEATVMSLDEGGNATRAMPGGGDVTLLVEGATLTTATTVLGVEAGDTIDLTPVRQSAPTAEVSVTYAPFPGAAGYSFTAGCGSFGSASPATLSVPPECIAPDGKVTIVGRASTAAYAVMVKKVVSTVDGGAAAVDVAEGDWTPAVELPTIVSGTTAVPGSLELGLRTVHGSWRDYGLSKTGAAAAGTASVPRAPFTADAIELVAGIGAFEATEQVYTEQRSGHTDGTSTFAVDLGTLLPRTSAVNATTSGGGLVVGWAMEGSADFRAATAARATVAALTAGGTHLKRWTLVFRPGAGLTVAPPALPPDLADAMSGISAWSVQSLEFMNASNAAYSELRRSPALIERIVTGDYTTPGARTSLSRRVSRFLLGVPGED